MRRFTRTELGRMQDAQDVAMQDTCIMEVWTEGAVDAYGVAQAGYVDSEALICGLDLTQNDLEESPSADVDLAEGRLRLPIDTVVDRRNRFRVTHRFGELLGEALRYEQVGQVRRWPSVLVCNVRLMTNERR